MNIARLSNSVVYKFLRTNALLSMRFARKMFKIKTDESSKYKKFSYIDIYKVTKFTANEDA